MLTTPERPQPDPTPNPAGAAWPPSAGPLSRRDSVTNLPNRRQFFEDYDRLNTPGAQLVMITLAEASHFNALLRALGHDYSEDFIRAGLARIGTCIPASLPLYHVSVLSFAFICPSDPAELVWRIIEVCARPLPCGGIPITAELGIGIVDCHGGRPADLLRNALVAAQDSRANHSGWARYNRSSDNAQRRAFQLLTDLPEAMAASDQLSLDYQPKIDLATGRLAGAEALLRWHHPVFGPVSPAEFVPLAETTSLIGELTKWVLLQAADQAACWRAQGLGLNLAVNVSPHNLCQVGFAGVVAAELRRRGVCPTSIEIEFTEGTLAANNATVLSELKALRAAGIHVALDDFGTGFSNLSYIAHLPADIIKIDKSFIQPIGTDQRTALLVRALIQLAHRLNYRVVAEGIETAEIYKKLAAWGCDEGQGYYMSKPLKIAEFDRQLRARPSLAAAAS